MEQEDIFSPSRRARPLITFCEIARSCPTSVSASSNSGSFAISAAARRTLLRVSSRPLLDQTAPPHGRPTRRLMKKLGRRPFAPGPQPKERMGGSWSLHHFRLPLHDLTKEALRFKQDRQSCRSIAFFELLAASFQQRDDFSKHHTLLLQNSIHRPASKRLCRHSGVGSRLGQKQRQLSTEEK
jgi:hypothetical protein